MSYKEYIVRKYMDRTEWMDKEGRVHREDGPAIEWANGNKEWYMNGKQLSEKEFNARNQDIILTLDEIAAKLNIPVERLKIKK